MPKWSEIWWEAPMEGSVLSFLKAEWKVSDFHVNLVVCFGSILPKYTSALLFSGINPSSEHHREHFVGCWSLLTSMGRRSHCNCPGLNNLHTSLWWHSKLNIKKWNAILYKQTHIFLHWGKQQQHNLPLIIFLSIFYLIFVCKLFSPGQLQWLLLPMEVSKL